MIENKEDISMKEIKIEFSNDQSEVLDYISQMFKKDTSDLIREALVCLLPINEYIELKRNLIVLQDQNDLDTDKKVYNTMANRIHDINISTSERLKRIGI